MNLRIDLQTHTSHSKHCGWMSPEQLVEAATKVLDGIAVTDHNTMTGVNAAVATAPDDFLIIPGEEIDTSAGQIIGLFLNSEIAPGQPPQEVINEIHKQDGIAFVPHPFDALRGGLTDIEAHADTLDGIEVLNSRCVRDTYNKRAAFFASDHDLIPYGGSDAHFAHEIGNAYTLVHIEPSYLNRANITSEIVSTALKDGKTSTTGQRGSILNHLGTKAVKVYRAHV